MNDAEIKKIEIRQDFQSEFNYTIDQKVERYLEIDHHKIIANHHFSEASSECIKLYSDGYFMSAVMVTQAVNEGIVRFVAERNSITFQPDNDKNKTKSMPKLINELEQKGIFLKDCAEASRQICKSFRNDVHHMNPKVAEIISHFRDLAKRNIQDLAKIEKEIFGATFAPDGRLILKQPKYWDFNKDGKVSAYLRLSP
jgi:hypothetical protein